MKEVEESIWKCVENIEAKIPHGNVPELMTLIDHGIQFAKENDQHLSSKARIAYSGFYLAKSKFLLNPVRIELFKKISEFEYNEFVFVCWC